MKLQETLILQKHPLQSQVSLRTKGWPTYRIENICFHTPNILKSSDD